MQMQVRFCLTQILPDSDLSDSDDSDLSDSDDSDLSDSDDSDLSDSDDSDDSNPTNKESEAEGQQRQRDSDSSSLVPSDSRQPACLGAASDKHAACLPRRPRHVPSAPGARARGSQRQLRARAPDAPEEHVSCVRRVHGAPCRRRTRPGRAARRHPPF